MERDDILFWKTASMKDRAIARESLWQNYCLFKGINPDGLKLQRILKLVKYPQS